MTLVEIFDDIRRAHQLPMDADFIDRCTEGELALAAIAYIQAAYCQLTHEELQVYWPWDSDFNPDPNDDRSNLIRYAFALLLAELARLDDMPQGGTHHE